MGLCGGLARFFVIIVNIVFLLVGIACLAVGLIGRFGDEITSQYLDTAQKELNDAISKTGLGSGEADIDMNQLLMTASIVMISIGSFLCVVAFLGTFGACCRTKTLLILYIVICAVLLIGEIVAVILIYATTVLTDNITFGLKESLKDYKGLGGSNFVSVAWNIMMIQGKCCGVEGYGDFNASSNWNRTVGNGSTMIDAPLACCVTLPTNQTFMNCADKDDNNAWNIHAEGCFNKYWEWTLGNTAIVAGVLCGVGVFQLLLIVSAVVVYKNDDDNKIHPSDKGRGRGGGGRGRSNW